MNVDSDERERDMRERKSNYGCLMIAVAMGLTFPIAFVVALTDCGWWLVIPVALALVGVLYMPTEESGGSSSGGGFFTPPKNPRYLRRKIRHRMGW